MLRIDEMSEKWSLFRGRIRSFWVSTGFNGVVQGALPSFLMAAKARLDDAILVNKKSARGFRSHMFFFAVGINCHPLFSYHTYTHIILVYNISEYIYIYIYIVYIDVFSFVVWQCVCLRLSDHYQV